MLLVRNVNQKISPRIIRRTTALAAIIIFSYIISQRNYLLFHTGIELLSIIVAFSIAAIAANTYKYSENGFFLFLGLAYTVIGTTDLLHTLAHEGMGVFAGTQSNHNLATQLWIAARYTESVSILSATFYLTRPLNLTGARLFYFGGFALLMLSIFYWQVFPTCLVPETGLTPFKIYSEYIISVIILAALVQLIRHQRFFQDKEVYYSMIFGYSITIFSELMFTQYFSVHDLSNIIGHQLKFFSCYFIYLATVKKNLILPYRQLAETNQQLQFEIERRETAEAKRKQYEQELSKISKLDSIALLASGLSHDFKNLLTVILGNVTLAELHLMDDKKNPINQNIQHIKAAAQQSSELTNRLLSFARGEKPVKKSVALKPLIIKTMELALSGSPVRIVYNFDENLPPLDVDLDQFKQVLHNIVINAVQAMPQGGLITVDVSNLKVDPQDSAIPLQGGEYISLSISDQGKGIPAEHLDSIFDPFFTTKSNGHGLGLPTSYSIIKNHGGHITVSSQRGIGSTFIIYIPAGQEGLVQEATPQDQVPHHGRGRILLMDDSQDIRKITGNMLTQLGYQPVLAKDGKEALQVYQSYTSQGMTFAAVILNLTVRGGMGGEKAAKKFKLLDYQLPLILSTGRTKHPAVMDFSKLGFKATLTKPYSIHELGQVLTRVMGQGSIEEAAATKD